MDSNKLSDPVPFRKSLRQLERARDCSKEQISCFDLFVFGTVAFWILLEKQIVFLIESNDRGDSKQFYLSFSLASLGCLFRTSFELLGHSQECGTIQESPMTRPYSKMSTTMNFHHEDDNSGRNFGTPAGAPIINCHFTPLSREKGQGLGTPYYIVK